VNEKFWIELENELEGFPSSFSIDSELDYEKYGNIQKELYNSDFLGWIFTIYNQENSFSPYFMDEIQFPPHPFKFEILTQFLKKANLEIQGQIISCDIWREYCIPNSKKRLDLFVNYKIQDFNNHITQKYLIIENKLIDSPDEQLSLYKQLFPKQLFPIDFVGWTLSSVKKSHDFIHVSYQDVSEILLKLLENPFYEKTIEEKWYLKIQNWLKYWGSNGSNSQTLNQMENYYLNVEQMEQLNNAMINIANKINENLENPIVRPSTTKKRSLDPELHICALYFRSLSLNESYYERIDPKTNSRAPLHLSFELRYNGPNEAGRTKEKIGKMTIIGYYYYEKMKIRGKTGLQYALSHIHPETKFEFLNFFGQMDEDSNWTQQHLVSRYPPFTKQKIIQTLKIYLQLYVKKLALMEEVFSQIRSNISENNQ